MGLLEKMRRAEAAAKESAEDASDEVTERAHEVLQIIGERVETVRPARVIFASIAVLLIFSAMLIITTWLVPYDRTSVDIVYLQGGSGHVVLVEIDNKGSRSILDVNLDIRFLDSAGLEIGRATFETDEIPAHTSVAGDQLELLINGASVWENYTIEILLDYTYGGEAMHERWTHAVGEWTMETFTDSAPIRLF